MSTDLDAVRGVIDLDRYPIDDLDSPRGKELLAFCHAALAFEGACQLPGFFRPEAVAALVDEALRKQDVAWRTDDKHNVYFEKVTDDGGPDVPRNRLQHTSKAAVAWDLVDADSPLRTAYEWDGLTAFLGRALAMDDFHPYADELGAASLMVFDEGDELGWHFDRSPFAVTVMLQPSQDGGEYQYHHHLRGAEDENEAGVLAALDDAHPNRITLTSPPGALTMFRGQYSMHRVTPVAGSQRRVNAVLAYSERPDDKMNALTQKLFYGRTA
ncbi:HalD/BesD family halogenase [Solicola sp. PLA-1-18]|uniref:HalD/BesD family halogenase n=1 Tax=Solicola sp. PLA-1-18 TaxID=3380532 RepID=UPI003B7C7A24